MNRKLKALGLALVAALALTAVLAGSASAQFTSNKEHTIITGSQEGSHVFKAGSGFGGITCSTASFSGTAQNKSEETQVITPTYSGCKDSLNRTVDIDNSSLTYTFTSGKGEKGGTKGQVDVSGGMTLTVTSGGSVVCTVVIASPQTDNGITYDNLGGTSGVRVTSNSTNVKNTTSGGFFNCGITDGEHTAGSYEGTTVITGKDTSNNAAEISVD